MEQFVGTFPASSVAETTTVVLVPTTSLVLDAGLCCKVNGEQSENFTRFVNTVKSGRLAWQEESTDIEK